MATARHHFWSDWPAASQQRFFKLVLRGIVLVTVGLIVGLKLYTGSVDLAITQAKEQYGRVVPLVEDVKSLRAQMGVFAHLPVKDAIWHIIDDLNIEKHLTSIRPTQLSEHEEGLQVTFTGLSLTKLTDFLHALRDKASLQTPDCTISRNPDDPRLADVHLVLAR
ncbi:hypothetical protein [uncultured Pseudodesulfovibrio sp.]|uniref:hypothetical protein n=1 Tax=uncultured Pseudodesulfovibrio sp. TaxID=2035858 RepID=UPI0029C6DCC6|nr:hypothetical protein [uncultured Pseudodesulfovibrio sp.]